MQMECGDTVYNYKNASGFNEGKGEEAHGITYVVHFQLLITVSASGVHGVNETPVHFQLAILLVIE